MGPWTIRPAGLRDIPFLWEMLLTAAKQPDDSATPSRAELLGDDRITRYLEGWGRAGDLAVVAHEQDDRPIGAAWCRLLTSGRPGYGYVDEETPEIGIALLPAWRGQGIGRALLAELQAAAVRSGVRALSLSVDARNEAAVRLYRSLGFATVGGDGDHPTMRWSADSPALSSGLTLPATNPARRGGE
jgi:ribosomal protein S18 acetylase RimI-like enzyme